jgi:ketosteroid isomerase-like protein
MSQETVDLVRRAYEAFNRGDYEAAAAAFHAEAEWYPYLATLEGSVYRGREALVGMFKQLDEGFSGGVRVEVQEIIDCGEQLVVVLEAHGKGVESGAVVRQRWAQLASIRAGLVFRVTPFPDRAAALESLEQRE